MIGKEGSKTLLTAKSSEINPMLTWSKGFLLPGFKREYICIWVARHKGGQGSCTFHSCQEDGKSAEIPSWLPLLKVQEPCLLLNSTTLLLVKVCNPTPMLDGSAKFVTLWQHARNLWIDHIWFRFSINVFKRPRECWDNTITAARSYWSIVAPSLLFLHFIALPLRWI